MGGEWVKTADIKLIHAAAYRLTSNEQMEKLSRAYRQMLEGGEYEDAHDVMDNIDLQIYPPTELKGEEEAIADYFKDVSLQYYVFREMAKEVDGSEIDGCRESNRELGSDFCFSEIPNHEFRRFEDGWTKAVRKFHMSYLQECRKAGCR